MRKLLPLLLFIGFTSSVTAQVQTPIYQSMTANSNGYYEYLPIGYNSNTQNYPLMIFLHGLGELGDGSPAQLPKVLQNGPPHLINIGQFPATFTVNGQTFSFIVISPQFIGWPSPNDVDEIINYCISHYRVDVNRIYLTGLSMGGGGTWEYAGYSVQNANRLAAIVPVCGASYPEITRARNMANSNLPVWATHNNGDPQVPVSYTIDYVDEINQAPSPAVLAKRTIFNNNSHDAWTATYNTSFTENGLNVYQWMLQYQRNFVTLPVTLTNYSATLTGDRKVTINWKTASESNNARFSIERSADGLHFTTIGTVAATNAPNGSQYSFDDRNALVGNNYYRLSQTDINGFTTYFSVKQIVITDNTKLFKISPNPVTTSLLLQLNNDWRGNIQVVVIDEKGVIAKTINLKKENDLLQQSINVASLAKGYYVLKITAGIDISTQSFIKN